MTSFVEAVNERVKYPEQFVQFKDLSYVYECAKKVGVPRPKVYLAVSLDDAYKFDWATADTSLPNIFVMRPSIFVNRRHEVWLADHGKDLGEFSMQQNITREAAWQQQLETLKALSRGVDWTPKVYFEEFILAAPILQPVPATYQAHVFWNKVGFIKRMSSRSGDKAWWAWGPEYKDWHVYNGTSFEVNTTNQTLAQQIVPAAEKLGHHLGFSYLRLDFIRSLRGPILRSIAATPGDVRRDTSGVYSKLDTMLGLTNMLGLGKTEQDEPQPQEEPSEESLDDNL